MKKSDITPLLGETNKAYYWIGFIMADGCFQNNKSISLCLGQKDEPHIKKYGEFINYTGKRNNPSIGTHDIKLVPIIAEKFDIKSRKTYNPPNINIFNNMKDDLFMSLLIGFIDGDGSIVYTHKGKNTNLRIKCHSSWLPILKYFDNKIKENTDININNKVKINNQGYSQLIWSDNRILKYLKNKTTQLKLPILERKWNKINIDFVSRQEKGKYHIEIIKKMKTQGYRNIDIANFLNIGKSGVRNIIVRNKLEEI